MDTFREERIEKLLAQIGAAISRGHYWRINTGNLLMELKELVEHGQWLALLAEIGLKERTAQQYMKEARDDYNVQHKLANVPDCSMEAGDEERGDEERRDEEAGDEEAGDEEAGDGEAGDGEAGDGEAGDGEAGDGEEGDASDVELGDGPEYGAGTGEDPTKLTRQKRPDNVGAMHNYAGATRKSAAKTRSILAPPTESIRIGLEVDPGLAAALTRMRPTAQWARVKVDLVEVLRKAALEHETPSAAMEAAA
jgi:hypothetical protein